MAFSKRIDLPNGFRANIVRLVSYRVEYDTKEASATFKLYRDEAATVPAAHQVIRLRLSGADFDAAFSKEAKTLAELAGLSNEAEAIFYRVAKQAPQLAYSDFDTRAGEKLDPVLADAEDI